ncbi:pseudouridine synthase [Alteromonadaceae bacterium BrNp21-10]|nr:pseudouridine synthase [Alteromonadaceae bacterium BrNp21-10]
MSIASRPSFITLPPLNNGWENLLAFLCAQFPHIEPLVWECRLRDGKVQWRDGEMATADSAFEPNRTLAYYREVQQEPVIEGAHKILFQNEHFLMADKPHFLPVTPGGKYVNECLLERLRHQYNLPNVVCAHRIDRHTAGLVLFSTNPQSRSAYCQLFMDGAIQKHYSAVASTTQLKQRAKITLPQQWQVEGRIVRSEPKFTFCQTGGVVNARSSIELVAISGELGMFELSPITGKTHQLRLHMASIGAPILYDGLYPSLQPEKPDDASKPLQLLARELIFTDPITQQQHHFHSELTLNHWSI